MARGVIAKYFTRKPEAVNVYPDGREVCQDNAAGRREYFRRTRLMAERQNQICALCERFMCDVTFEHQEGRGMAGGFRDDRTEIDGNWYNAAAHSFCNSIKGNKRFHWVDGKYVEKERA